MQLRRIAHPGRVHIQNLHLRPTDHREVIDTGAIHFYMRRRRSCGHILNIRCIMQCLLPGFGGAVESRVGESGESEQEDGSETNRAGNKSEASLGLGEGLTYHDPGHVHG